MMYGNTAKMISFKPPAVVQTLAQVFKSQGFDLWLVGGGLRNIALGQGVSDWDFATQATPDQMLAFLEYGIDGSADFGCIMVPSGLGNLQITTFRKESHYKDHRRPHQVGFTQRIEEDLARRDFTSNAMAYHILEKTWLDPYNGIDDLQSNCLKTVGDPKIRFREDALRMLRALRFQSQYGFKLDLNIIDAVVALQKDIKFLSKERIWAEWIKLLEGDFVNDAIETLQGFDNLFQLPFRYPRPKILISKFPKNYRYRMLGLFEGDFKCIGTRSAAQWVAYGIPRKDIKHINSVADLVQRYQANGLDVLDKVSWLKLLFSLKNKTCLLLTLKHLGLNEVSKMLSDFIELHPDFSFSKLPISTQELMSKSGLSQGPDFGRLLKKLHAFIVSNPKNISKQTIEKWLEDHYSSQNVVS